MLSIYRKVFGLLSPHERRRAILVFVTMFGVAVSEVAGVASVMPFIAVLAKPDLVQENRWLALTYESLGFTSQRSFLFFLGALFFVLLVGSLVLKAIGTWAQLRFSNNRTLTWSARLMAAYLRQPYEWFLNKHSADLATSILAEVDTVAMQAMTPAMQAIAQAMVSLMLLTLLVAVDPVLALTVGLTLGSVYAIMSMALRRYQRRIGDERRKANRARFHVVQEAFGGVKDVKIGGLEEQVLARFRVPAHVRAQRQISSGLAGSLPSLFLQGLLFGGMLLLLIYLVSQQGSFQNAVPVVSVYALAGYRLMPALQKTFEEAGKLRSSETAVDALAEDLEQLEASAVKRVSGNKVPPIGLRRELALQSISYRYPNAEKLALDDVSVALPAYDSIGLVGSTGSGKTTLVDVILGLLTPQVGTISVDGTLIDTPELVQRWQRSLGYVPQQIFLADDTIAANIAFGVARDRIDMAAVERAARMAELHDFVTTQLPDGYSTRVGERGVRLSGGQRQRIGIARALYHDPDILILDEATSALDNLTEQAVMNAVKGLGRQKTVIMIAHRLSTVRHCDRIYFLEQGRIVDAGTYDELVDSNARFRQLAEATVT